MNTQKLIQEAKARFKHHENKLYLQEKYKSKLTFTSQGGMWTVTKDFLAFLSSASHNVIIQDDFGNPVQVDTQQLLEESWAVYNTAMSEWHQEYTALQNLR